MLQGIILHTDGGARGNPGPAGAGYVAFAASGAVVCEGSTYIGRRTNNYAEYTAVILGLSMLIEHFGAAACRDLTITVRMDSELVCRQLNGVYRVKHPDLLPLYREVCTLVATKVPHTTFEHVRREHNTHADRLSNDAMDRGV